MIPRSGDPTHASASKGHVSLVVVFRPFRAGGVPGGGGPGRYPSLTCSAPLVRHSMGRPFARDESEPRCPRKTTRLEELTNGPEGGCCSSAAVWAGSRGWDSRRVRGHLTAAGEETPAPGPLQKRRFGLADPPWLSVGAASKSGARASGEQEPHLEPKVGLRWARGAQAGRQRIRNGIPVELRWRCRLASVGLETVAGQAPRSHRRRWSGGWNPSGIQVSGLHVKR